MSAPPAGRAAGLGAEGLEVGGLALGWPELSLWRAPTDNDDPPGRWRTRSAVRLWREAGLDRLEVEERTLARRGGGLVRTTRWRGSGGCGAVHRQHLRVDGDRVRIDERVDVDAAIVDLPRVGVAFVVPAGGAERLEWFGLGPGDSYPDRRSAARVGRWREEVGAQAMPFVVPQEFGLHLDTRWFSLSGRAGGRGLTVSGDRLFAFSALPFSAGDLTRATHAHQLVPRAETYVQIDVAHRGLGTAACGPDTHPRFRIGPGSYRWTWYLSQSGRRARPT